MYYEFSLCIVSLQSDITNYWLGMNNVLVVFMNLCKQTGIILIVHCEDRNHSAKGEEGPEVDASK